LAILRKTSQLELSVRSLARIPEDSTEFTPTDDDLKEVEQLFDDDLRVPLNFRTTAPPQSAFKPDPDFFGSHYYRNPQTKEFCEKLQIPDLNEQLCIANMQIVGDPHYLIGRKLVSMYL
jgi:hypothetical protein